MSDEPRDARAELEDLRQLIEGVDDQLWALDLRTGQVRMSRFFQQLLGYEDGELEPTLEAWQNLCHPDDLLTLERLSRENALGLRSHAEFDYRARRKDGSWIRLLSRSTVVTRDEQGAPVRVVGTIADLTALKRSEERMSALLRAIPDLIFRVHADGTCLDVSGATSEWALGPPEHVIGRPLQQLPLPRSMADLLLLHMERTLREGTLRIFDHELDRPEGRQSYEVRISRSGPDEAVLMIRNVTEHRLVEEQRAQLARTEKLASLGQLAAGIAHEITSPVSYVASNLNELGRCVSSLAPLLEGLREVLSQADMESLEELPKIVQESQAGVQRIKEIIQSLRHFAREDSEPQAMDVNAELEASLRIVASELKYKCEVTRDYGLLPPVMGRASQLGQVFINLLVNAAQAIETWGTIRIRTRREGDEVRVDISDTGKGMTPEIRARLFAPFFTTKPRGQGTGLGLSISSDIVSRHGGRLEVQSEPGQGSTFTLYLPIAAS